MGAIFRRRKCYTGKVKEQPIYSTDEIFIGYIDINGTRKKLYQKDIPFTLPSTFDGTVKDINIPIGATVDFIKPLGGYIALTTNSLQQIPQFIGNEKIDIPVCFPNNYTGTQYQNCVRLRHNIPSSSSSAWGGRTGYITVQYTKV